MGTANAQCYGTGRTGQAGNWASARVSIFNSSFPRQATSTLGDLWIFNKQVPVDLDLGAMAVCGLNCSALVTPRFSFQVKFAGTQTPMPLGLSFWLCLFELKTCLAARTSRLERGIKDLAVNKYESPNGMHSASFKALGLFEISSPIKSKRVQKHLETRGLST